MDKLKVWSLILGIIGLALVFMFLTFSLIDVFTQYSELLPSELWYTTVYSTSAILWSVAFTLGATAIVLHAEKKGAYFMALSTIIGAMGFVPIFVLATGNPPSTPASAIPIVFLTVVTILLLLVSTILLAIPTKPKP